MTRNAQNVLSLYRQILKAAQYFPSRKRNNVIREIKAEFRANKVCSRLDDNIRIEIVPISVAAVTDGAYRVLRVGAEHEPQGVRFYEPSAYTKYASIYGIRAQDRRTWAAGHLVLVILSDTLYSLGGPLWPPQL